MGVALEQYSILQNSGMYALTKTMYEDGSGLGSCQATSCNYRQIRTSKVIATVEIMLREIDAVEAG